MIYLTFSVACVIAGSLVIRWGAKRTLPIAVLGYTVYVASYISPMACSIRKVDFFCSNEWVISTALLGSFVMGFAASVLWVAQSAYIKQCSDSVTINENQGLFYAINNFNNIPGNLLAIFFATNGQSQLIFFAFMTLLTLVAAGILCCILRCRIL